jgi:hypothetical protein
MLLRDRAWDIEPTTEDILNMWRKLKDKDIYFTHIINGALVRESRIPPPPTYIIDA